MVWSKWSDTVATDPRVVGLDDERDPRLRHEALGFFLELVSQSAAHMTDYQVTPAVARRFGGQRTTALLRVLQRQGLLTAVGEGRSRTYAIINDEEFVNLRLASEVAWERQRKADSRNPELTVPARRRDGDGCRYCGAIVRWLARKGPRAGTYDHRVPGVAGTLETYVVACTQCNQKRGDDPQADERIPLLPPPSEPYYSQRSVDFLAHHGVEVAVSTGTAPGQTRSATDPGTGTQPDPVAAPARPATRRPAGHRSSTRSTRDSAASGAPQHDQLDPRLGNQPGTAAPARHSDPAVGRSPQHHAVRTTATPHPAAHRSTTDQTGTPQHHSDPEPPPSWATDGPDPGGQPPICQVRQIDGLTVGSGRDGTGREPPGDPPPPPSMPSTHPPPLSPARSRGRRGRPPRSGATP